MSRNQRILLVEDEDDDLMMLTQLIQRVMHQDVAIARDGLEAVRLAQNERFKLVLLDLRLPNLQDVDVVETLRSIDGYQNVPVIALTPSDLEGAPRRSLEAGCDEYLTKPIDIDRFVQILSDYLTLTV